MAEKILMIALSPTMENGMISRWNKQEGDYVKQGSPLCEVETDKATMEYESPVEGTLLKILLPEGGKASIGNLIGIIGKKGEDIGAIMNEINVLPKGKVEPARQPLTGGIPDSLFAHSPVQTPTQTASHGQKIKISPLARRMANEQNIALDSIAGSGPGGRIIKRDIEKLLAQKQTSMKESKHSPETKPLQQEKVTSPTAPITRRISQELLRKEVDSEKISLPAASSVPKAVAGTTVVPIPVETTGLATEIIPVSQKRKIIAERLSQSKFSAPHYYLKLSVNMDSLLRARQELNSMLETKVSMNAFFIKFCAEALKKHPMINARWKGETIEKCGYVDIGLAVAIPDGLIVPVIRNCTSKGICAIDSELQILVGKAKNNKLTLEEFQNATFTISNLGSYGIEEFTAIINPPGSAILAIGEIRKEPVVVDDKIVIQSRVKLTLSCDHRIIDGATGASFLKDMKEMIESPIKTLY